MIISTAASFVQLLVVLNAPLVTRTIAHAALQLHHQYLDVFLFYCIYYFACLVYEAVRA